jgi:hypothetical protein
VPTRAINHETNMRELSKGSYCLHRAMPDWGTGLVKTVNEQQVVVFFEHGGTRPIARGYVGSMLRVVSVDEVTTELRATLERGEQKPPRGAKTAAAAKRCKACYKPLENAVYAEKRNWKSCPQCSAQNGEFHVFYEYPRAFATTETKSAAKGAKGLCNACRDGERALTEARLCGTLG